MRFCCSRGGIALIDTDTDKEKSEVVLVCIRSCFTRLVSWLMCESVSVENYRYSTRAVSVILSRSPQSAGMARHQGLLRLILATMLRRYAPPICTRRVRPEFAPDLHRSEHNSKLVQILI